MIMASVITRFFSNMTSAIQKRKKNTVNITAENNMAPDESSPQTIKDPIYDDIVLTDKTSTIDLSKNIAYVCTQN